MKVHPVAPCVSLTATGAAPYLLLATVPSPALKVAKRQSDGGKSNGVILCVGLNKTAVDANEQLQQTTELADASCDIFCHLFS
jgi:hypothetical protein